MEDFGGNKVKQVDFSAHNQIDLAPITNASQESHQEYCYRFIRMSADDMWEPPTLLSYTVYILKATPDAEVELFDGNEPLNVARIVSGDAIQVEAIEDDAYGFQLNVEHGEVEILLAGVPKSVGRKGVTHLPAAKLKRVTKPWGHELWINGEHPGYAFKQIFVRATHKTSLQYHQRKIETNLLYSGRARLHFKRNQTVSNDQVTSADIGTTDLAPISIVGVVPPVLHRLEALTDILLYETSTPHLDDVIRVSDDAQRPNGRIAEEHSA